MLNKLNICCLPDHFPFKEKNQRLYFAVPIITFIFHDVVTFLISARQLGGLDHRRHRRHGLSIPHRRIAHRIAGNNFISRLWRRGPEPDVSGEDASDGLEPRNFDFCFCGLQKHC